MATRRQQSKNMVIYPYSTGDIFESKMQVIVNPVNCVGVMGGGLAAEFKKRYYEMFLEYRFLCESEIIVPGFLHYWNENPPWEHSVLNFPTKDDWKNPSELSYIRDGLQDFVERYKEMGITSIAFPALGAGLGGLDWADVEPIMLYFLNQVDIPVEIYLPK